MIELLIDGHTTSLELPHYYGEPMRVDYQKFADYLLANGVVVLPCKVGNTVYVVYGREVQKTSVFRLKMESEDDHWESYCKCMVRQGGNRFEHFRFGVNVFLTREEAERALEGAKSYGKVDKRE